MKESEELGGDPPEGDPGAAVDTAATELKQIEVFRAASRNAT
jgi:hypothetical protein